MSSLTFPIDQVVDWLNQSQKILLIIHQSPDGDTIASSLALYRALKKINKTVIVVGKDPIPTPFLFLPEVDSIQKDYLGGDWDVIVVLDCGDLKRTGFAQRILSFAKERKRLINIDHHPKNDLHKIANLTYFDSLACATGEIIAKIIDRLEVKFDHQIATCLLTALYTDTGGFKHSNTTHTTLELASRLMSSGARLNKITQNIANSKSVRSLKLWGIVLSRIKHYHDLGLITSVVSQKDLKLCLANVDDLAGAVNLIGSVPNAQAAILFVELPDGQIKASLRTESNVVDVSRLAKIFGGGGHKKASGFIINGQLFQDYSGWRILVP